MCISQGRFWHSLIQLWFVDKIETTKSNILLEILAIFGEVCARQGTHPVIIGCDL